MRKRKLTTMRDRIASIKTCGVGLIAMIMLSGCSFVGQYPSVTADGAIVGGEPRLRSLLEIISKGRPAGKEGQHQHVHYVVSIYPVQYLVVLEGVLPKTQDKVMANYTMLVSVDSAESAMIAVITESTVKLGIDEDIAQHSQAFRWDNNRWVAKSFAELQISNPGASGRVEDGEE